LILSCRYREHKKLYHSPSFCASCPARIFSVLRIYTALGMKIVSVHFRRGKSRQQCCRPLAPDTALRSICPHLRRVHIDLRLVLHYPLYGTKPCTAWFCGRTPSVQGWTHYGSKRRAFASAPRAGNPKQDVEDCRLCPRWHPRCPAPDLFSYGFWFGGISTPKGIYYKKRRMNA
jgi:hypothetical protein